MCVCKVLDFHQIASTEAGKVVWELRSTEAITSWGTYGFDRRDMFGEYNEVD